MPDSPALVWVKDGEAVTQDGYRVRAHVGKWSRKVVVWVYHGKRIVAAGGGFAEMDDRAKASVERWINEDRAKNPSPH